MPKRTIILAGLLVPLIAGCSLVHYGIFISTMQEEITLEVRQLESSGTFEGPKRYKLGAGRTKRAVCLIAEVTATDMSGRKLFQQVLASFRPEWDKFKKPGEREIYYLVTRDGAYPIPIEWRKTWKEHQQEIISGFDVNAAREKLIKAGMLKK